MRGREDQRREIEAIYLLRHQHPKHTVTVHPARDLPNPDAPFSPSPTPFLSVRMENSAESDLDCVIRSSSGSESPHARLLNPSLP